MADPSNKIPHIIGAVLDGTGVANSQVVAENRTSGERLIKSTDANKRVTFDLSNLPSGYSASDVIELQNVGASVGSSTITVNSATGGFQQTTIACAASPNKSINI